ncbi:MAG: single-stranded DNA-binding protein [Verrucomicrobia bacterium]|nr:MAG: single-stranded DNA-binding protein [Verrucomicrobiota bacterium]TAE87141.1 MAG: single-stranded DNA-binding protein [Verrucomicrobiota bacterium]TAF24945.1 MAG: single-stranded DNA-binding protein [Verrucomicrobiota bacterium]TAF40728.1 MAG: single-stranded DNA-binding protein [Verrucomicrobiota bacterium]
MANLNKVMLIGNLTRDPEVRYTPKGTAVGDLGMAVNRRVSDGNGNWSDEVTFVDVTVWGTNAENAQKYLTKGRGVFVEGRLQLDTWDDKQSGQKRSKLKVVAEVLQFLPDGKGGSQRSGGDGEYPSSRSGGSDSGYSNSRPSSPPQGGSAADAGDFRDEDDDIPF